MRPLLYLTCFLIALSPLQAGFRREVAVSDKDLPKQPAPPLINEMPPQEEQTPEPEPAPKQDGASSEIPQDLNKINEGSSSDDGYPIDLNKVKENADDHWYDKPKDYNQPSSEKPKQPALKSKKQKLVEPPPKEAPKAATVETQAVYPKGIILKETKGLVLFGSVQDYNRVDATKLRGLHIVDLKIPGNLIDFENRLNQIYLNKPLTVEVIEKLIAEIEAHYRETYRPIVKVIITKQSIEGSVLCLIVAESSVGKIESTGNTWLSSERLQEYVYLQPGEPIDERQIKASVDFINRNPFRSAEVLYKEGEKYQTTDLEFFIHAKRPLRVFLGTDNMGLSSIGRTRVFGGFNYGNFLGLDQILSYQFTSSVDFHSYVSNTASWIIPLPWKNVLEFFGGYSTVHADMPLPFSKSHGFSLQASTRYTIPLKVFVKEIAHEVGFGIDFKRMNNTLEFVEDFPVVGQYVNLSQIALNYKIILNYDFSRTTIQAEGFWSPGQIFGDQSKERYNSLRFGANPKYVYGKAEIKEQLFFKETGEFMMRAAGQLSSATLLPSEEFGLGGLETVRGYEERTINGDNALFLSLEVKTPAMRGIFTPHTSRSGIVVEDKWQVVFFSDYGTALTKAANVNYTSSNTAVVEPKRLYIAGAGPGLRYHIADYLYARADLGFKLKKDPQLYGGGWAMVHFMVIANF